MRPGSFSESSPTDRPRGRREQSSQVRQAKLRRAVLESLEQRTLLSTLPAPAVIGRFNVSGSDFAPGTNLHESTPTVAVDPTNPNRLVAAWSQYNLAPQTPVARLQGAVSTDGGASWSFPFSLSPTVFPDPTTSGPTIPFTRVLNASVGIDRAGNVSVAALQTNAGGNAGVVTFERYAFVGGSLVRQGPIGQQTRILHEWNTDPQSAAQNVTLIVDDTPEFADAGNGQVHVNPYSGNVYVAWNTLDLGPTQGNDQLAPQAIYAVGSSDGGQSFTSPRRISDSGFNRTGGGAVTGPVGHRMPRLAISPAPATNPASPARGGQVSFVWDDFATATGTTNLNIARSILTYDRTEAVLHQRFQGAGGAITDATDPGGGAAHTPGVTLYTVPVNIDDPRFVTIEDLDVEVRTNHSNVAELRIVLVPPPEHGLAPIVLLDNNLTAGNANTGQGATGAGLGGNSPYGVLTPGALNQVIFDAQAQTSIVNQAAPRGYFRPREANLAGLAQVNGRTPAQLNGVWTLEITDFRATTGTPLPPRTLNEFALRFGAGLTPQVGGREVARSTVLGSTGQGGSIGTTASPINMNASPVIAIDTTLGVERPQSGRIYVAYTHRDRSDQDDNPADNTDIYLAHSDNGGLNWSLPRRVNDDLGDRDGFSGADLDLGVPSRGRPQFMPEVAVDATTGALVVQFYDTRHDASRGRVATYMTASIDGGSTFSPQVFVNEPERVFDVAAQRTRDVGPIPDNQASGQINTTFGYGTRQGLAVLGGRVYSAWSGNLNGGPNGESFLDVRVARATLPSGPRVIDGTSGVVPTTNAGDTPEAQWFDITFDRPIYFDPNNSSDPTNFTTADVAIRYRSPAGVPTDLTATHIIQLDASSTRFRVMLPAGPDRTRPGTYSYAIGPNIRDRVRSVDALGNTRLGNLIDQDGNALADLNQGSDVRFAMPRPVSGGALGIGPFVSETLPLIVPGPRVIGTMIVRPDGTAASASGPVLSGRVAGIQVTFDRDMQVSTFTVDDVLRVMGPAGEVDRSTFRIEADGDVARVFRILFAEQQLSGTYQVELGSNIQSVDGFLVDMNQNAGVDVLRGRPSLSEVQLSFVSAAVPRAIPANGTVESTIEIGREVDVADVNLQLNLTHPNVPNLRAELVAPDGRVILLFDGVGALGSRANFTNTVFDDQAGQPIANGTPPFSDRYRPQQPLGVLNNPVGAPTPPGTYTLRITNNGTSPGTLNSWRLIVRERVTGTGLGEPVADRVRTDFRIFAMAADDGLASSTWTPIGPAPVEAWGGATAGEGAGRVTAVAVDPSDPSGNTVYVGGASGGVWRTNNFLTLDAEGPTWVPLTDAAQINGLNIGGIAVFSRNNDPNQSIVLVSTGEGATGTAGVGFLRSMDGGASWTLLDSADNRTPFDQRGREFVGTTSFAVVADPRPTATGHAIFYAALSPSRGVPAAQGGLWRSTDSGETWLRLRAGQATDVLLDPYSNSPTDNDPIGNLQVVYAAFRGEGVFISPNQGQQLNLMPGGVGKPRLRDGDVFDPPAIPVTGQGPSPNGQKGRIVLAKPFLPDDAADNSLYQGWLYAAVATTGNTLDGLYLTKDQGQNWTRLQIRTEPPPAPSFTQYPVTPTNNTGSPALEYDPTTNAEVQLANYALALTVDPTNPNVVYLGGTRNGGGETALIRVDSTLVHDPHAFYLSNDEAGGPVRRNYTTGPAVLKPGDRDIPPDRFADPRIYRFINLYRDPSDPRDASATLLVNNTASINNSGAGVRWTPFDPAIGQTTDVQQAYSLVDPLTGRGRLIFGVDRGIFTAVDNGAGALLTQFGERNTVVPTGSRNGNLQLAQVYYGAVQPSQAAAQAAGALFYLQTDGNGFPRSAPNLLQSGDLNWSSLQLQTEAGSLSGGGVATDPTGSGVSYQYNWRSGGGAPKFGSDLNDFRTDFFLVGGPHFPVGRTNGLIQAGGGSLPDPQWPTPNRNAVVAGAVGGANFAVNPINPDQIVISAPGSGRVFRTLDRGLNWLEIGLPTVLGNSYFPALAFGAPAPDAPAGNVGDYVIGGNLAGQVYVTYTGGGAAGNDWIPLNDNGDLEDNTAPVHAIVTNPLRGTFEAYAVTSNGVYHIADTRTGSWRDITANLFDITHNIFGQEDQITRLLAAGGLRSLAVDWRYAIPDNFDQPPVNPTDPNLTHPVLYVGGAGGVFASYDDGGSWLRFPSAFPNSINTTPEVPGDGGGLPVVEVRDLDLSLGDVNRATGLPVSRLGDPNLLMASTFGRGAFAIRLGPVVFPETLRLVVGGDRLPISPQPPVISPTDLVFEGFSAQSVGGNAVRLRAFEIGPDDQIIRPLPLVDQGGMVPTTDSVGNFSIRIAPGALPTAGLKRIGIQAEQGGTTGNIAVFDLVVNVPAPTLAPESDTGRSATDNVTNVNTPTFQLDLSASPEIQLFRRAVGAADFVPVGAPDAQGRVTDQGPGGAGLPDGVYEYVTRIGGIASDAIIVTIDTVPPVAPGVPVSLTGDVTSAPDPIFSVGGAEPNAEVRLYRRRLTDPASPVPLIVGSAIAGADGVVTIRDLGPLADADYEYFADQVDLAGNVGPRGPVMTLQVRGSSVQPPAATLLLDPADDTGTLGDNVTANRRPRLIGATAAGATVQLVDEAGNPIGSPVQAGPTGMFTVQFPADLDDGTYRVRVRVLDLTGNAGQSDPLVLTILTTPPPGVSDVGLAAESDTGLRGDLRTSTRRPFLTGTTSPGSTVEIFGRVGAQDLLLAFGTADAQGRFRLQVTGELSNGTVLLRARSRDAAGNLGPFGPEVALSIVTTYGDYDNDGRADLALYRPGTADGQSQFLINRSTAGGLAVGSGQFRSADPGSPLIDAQLRPGDIPVTGDFDGDGITDTAIFRPSSDRAPGASEWIILGSRTGPRSVLFGGSGLDVPAVGDFDGDGISDIAVFRPVSDLLPGAAEWFILPSSTGQAYRVSFGAANGVDLPAVADYDGDGRDDIATFRPSPHPQDFAAFDPESNGIGAQWFILRSGLPTAQAGLRIEFGAATGQVPGGLSDQPVPGDYDGDGRADVAAYRPSTSEWFILRSGLPFELAGQSFTLGVAGDRPAPADYDGDGITDPTVFRPSTGEWTIRQSTDGQDLVRAFGTAGDVPILAPLSYRDPRPGSIANPLPVEPDPAAMGLVVQARQVAAPAPAGASLDLAGQARQLTNGTAGRASRGRPAEARAPERAEASARLRALRDDAGDRPASRAGHLLADFWARRRGGRPRA